MVENKRKVLTRKLILYESPYSGQLLKIVGAKNAFAKMMEFLNYFTKPEEIKEFSLSIYLPKEEEYDSIKLVKEAERLFGKGEKLLWKSHI